MTPPRLSSPIESLGERYDTLVVGSGYGGGIAACRLARAGCKVCVLERGRELQPGEYPNDTLGIVQEVQIDAVPLRLGSPQALFDLRVYDDINVAVGCGLGGTSLINAGIALRPDPRVLQDRRWAAQLQDAAGLEVYFQRAEAMLRPAVYPQRLPELAKFKALERCASGLGRPFARVPILVNFDALADGLNHVGVPQGACVACGDCISGCNFGAKNTVLMNYLPDAKRHGAEIFTGTRVSELAREARGWRLRVQTSDGGERAVTAATVVLAAGTLGSTEILLRSREGGLKLSPALGHRFSGNGDMVALSYNADVPVNAIGFGALDPQGREPVGPCSTGIIDARGGRPVDEGMIFVEGAAPGAFAKWLPALFAALAATTGEDTDSGLRDAIREKVRELGSQLAGPYTGAVHRTQICLVVSHDDAAGEIFLDGDRLNIRWPDVGRQAPLMRADDMLLEAARALGATHIPNPIWHELLGRKLMSGHPLGGCVLADDARDGVVNHRGQVFDDESGTRVHPGLYVMDGSIVPRSLGANPLLTIAGLAERCCELMLAEGNPIGSG
jgi:cholesterol oxidase